MSLVSTDRRLVISACRKILASYLRLCCSESSLCDVLVVSEADLEESDPE